MNQNMTMGVDMRRRRLTRHSLSVALAILVTLTLMTAVALAGTGGDFYSAPEAVSSASSSRGGAIRADANPSMNVALWYAPAAVGQECTVC